MSSFFSFKEFMSLFPQLTPAELAYHEGKVKVIQGCGIHPVTWCKSCGEKVYRHRLGCPSCRTVAVRHVYSNQGDILEHGRDFMFIDQRPLTEWT